MREARGRVWRSALVRDWMPWAEILSRMRSTSAWSGGGGAARGKTEAMATLGAHPVSGGEIKVMPGRYGPYVTDGTTNATIPKDVKPEDVTEAQAIEWIDARAAKGPPAKKKGARKAPAKKPAAKKKAPAKKAAAE